MVEMRVGSGVMAAVADPPRSLFLHPVVEAQVTEDRIAQHYRRFAPVIHRRCLALLGDPEEARDATHDVFVTVARKLDTFRGESDPLTWIYRIATNHCLNLIRSRKTRDRALSLFAQEPRAAVDEQSARQVERQELIAHLLSRFDDRKVQMLVHRYYDDMTQAEIAEVMQVSERTVRKTLKKLGEQLADLVKGPEGLREAL
jgi:RNA polymerase sigma-70 factor (ECF subfamily)